LHAGQVPLIQEILGFGAGPRVAIIPNGVRTIEANPYKKPSMQEPLRLVFLGDVSEAKGVPDLLRAVASLLPGEVSLTLVGPLKLIPQNQVLLKNCEGNGTVTFVGQKSKEDALSLLSQSHVLILPSKVENLPNVILEAYSLGIPVIATAVGGVPQLVAEGETGWLISVDGNLEANIVEKLKNAIVSKNTFEVISKAAFELSISKFSIDVVASRFQIFCKQVLASDSSPRETARNDQDG
jgi:glycosyltransferase involved in cell wall biosynthesis